ncbi:PTS sugar transporter subunit IIA [Azotosporobacter soli]|uniref:PTS sugar transporter subunit IIA n=1 Tax=Azotosporobacter soli TaxID=3055040 RepID=UPI0031FE568C
MNRLSKVHLKINIPVVNRVQAVEAAGKLLLSNGCVTTRYVDAVSRNLGSEDCMVISPWLALVHLQDEQHVMQSGMGLVTLHRPVPFDAGEINLVKVVMALAARTVAEQMGQLDAVAQLIARPGRMNRICRAETEAQVRQILNWKERGR